MADRRVFAVADHARRDLGRVDVRHHDALRAGIERAGRVEMLESRHPHHRRDPGILGGDADLRREVDRHRVVLHVDEQEIVAGGLHDLGDVDRARLAQPDPERQLAGLQAFLGVIADRDHRVASLVRARPTVDSAVAMVRTRPTAPMTKGAPE